ncbi:MAG: hypothetical protein D6681_02580 [Calditrichaeota bacterium]|nr:MAG: hypothetical protein D6681_02580 [Calditrichota bacterium]
MNRRQLSSTLKTMEEIWMNPYSTWTIEYSYSRESFHIGRAAEMVQRNIQAMRTGMPVDYVCIGIYGSREQAVEAMLEFRRNRTPCNNLSLL